MRFIVFLLVFLVVGFMFFVLVVTDSNRRRAIIFTEQASSSRPSPDVFSVPPEVPEEKKPQPANFRGPTGKPRIKGPSGPPPNY